MTYRKLIVWQKAAEFAKELYEAFASCKDYAFRDQIQRATVSIMNNIAEGHARHSDKAFRNFLCISRGSAAEVDSMLYLAKELNYLDQINYTALPSKTDEILKLLTSFIKKLS